MTRSKSPILRSASSPFSNLEIVLSSIRASLGPEWTFYEECLEGIVGAVARQDDAFAWFEQMANLVEGKQQIAFDHAGVLFLLRQMGIKVPVNQILSLEQHSRANIMVKRKIHLRAEL